MSKNAKEWITGIIIGIIISFFLAVKVIAAPVSEADMELLTKTVQAEAGNQSLIGKRLVARVILNRVDSEVFPDTIEEVLSQEGQFTTYRYLNKVNPTWQDQLAVKMEIESSLNDEVIYFRTGRYGCGKPMFRNGDHYFSSL